MTEIKCNLQDSWKQKHKDPNFKLEWLSPWNLFYKANATIESF